MAAVATPSGVEAAAAGGFLSQLDSWNEAASPCRYWPSDLLPAFMLKMAARGQCVNESMMLGSPDYALDKLRLANTLNDDTLRELAVRMFAYFNDAPCHAVAVLVAEANHH